MLHRRFDWQTARIRGLRAESLPKLGSQEQVHLELRLHIDR